MVTGYEIEKGKKNLTGQSVTIKKINERLDLFDVQLKESELDLGVKNRKPTDKEVNIAYLMSGPTCPISGDAITGKNARIEHENCRAKNSDTKFTVTSATGNQWKADRTLKEVEAVKNYQESKQ